MRASFLCASSCFPSSTHLAVPTFLPSPPPTTTRQASFLLGPPARVAVALYRDALPFGLVPPVDPPASLDSPDSLDSVDSSRDSSRVGDWAVDFRGLSLPVAGTALLALLTSEALPGRIGGGGGLHLVTGGGGGSGSGSSGSGGGGGGGGGGKLKRKGLSLLVEAMLMRLGLPCRPSVCRRAVVASR